LQTSHRGRLRIQHVTPGCRLEALHFDPWSTAIHKQALVARVGKVLHETLFSNATRRERSTAVALMQLTAVDSEGTEQDAAALPRVIFRVPFLRALHFATVRASTLKLMVVVLVAEADHAAQNGLVGGRSRWKRSAPDLDVAVGACAIGLRLALQSWLVVRSIQTGPLCSGNARARG
jgi:hypothetical protein